MSSDGDAESSKGSVGTAGDSKTPRKDWRKSERRRGAARRGGRRKRRGREDADSESRTSTARSEDGPEAREQRGAGRVQNNGKQGADSSRRKTSKNKSRDRDSGGERGNGSAATRKSRSGRGAAQRSREGRGPESKGGKSRKGAGPQGETQQVSGLLLVDNKGGSGFLRRAEFDFLPRKDDVHVAERLVQRFKLRSGMLIEGLSGPGHGKHRRSLSEVSKVDGEDPQHWSKVVPFKSLTSIDPDFHYAVGDATEHVSLRILDIICPVGRGTRGLIVAPPRSGKTVLMQTFAKAIEEIYPDVRLMVLLVDERPEEATEWRRSTAGEVYVSTNDEPPERHVKLAEAVWMRCQRLVEIGEDVVLLLDSITRLARAYNNTVGAGSGRTMSGGLDSRAMERPKQFFGSARNTETAGSLTILGTTLVETGSRMDQVIFEEFKGTGNMEIVLSRKLADRRIFPAIDIERSGTRKEEKLISSHRLRQIHTLRRVLARMHFVEAMELLINKLEEVEKTDDFLKRFEVDPDA